MNETTPMNPELPIFLEPDASPDATQPIDQEHKLGSTALEFLNPLQSKSGDSKDESVQVAGLGLDAPRAEFSTPQEDAPRQDQLAKLDPGAEMFTEMPRVEPTRPKGVAPEAPGYNVFATEELEEETEEA